jgi:hypothetical protein
VDVAKVAQKPAASAFDKKEDWPIEDENLQ